MNINDDALRKALDQETTWKSVPMPTPEGKVAEALQGHGVGRVSWLVVHWQDNGHEGYDGTCIFPPFTFVHLSPEIAKEAFLKGKAWMEAKND